MSGLIHDEENGGFSFEKKIGRIKIIGCSNSYYTDRNCRSI